VSELQFDKAEYADTTHDGPHTCTGCGVEISGDFWEVNGGAVCPACHARVTAPPPGTPATRFWSAFGLGAGAALLGFLLHYGVWRATGYEIGLVAVAIGFGVGVGVRYGAKGVGGLGYQFLAVGLTYLAITMSYFALLVSEVTKNGGEITGLGYLIAFGYALAMPFLAGIENLIGLLIIAFGLWEAWKINKAPARPVIDGPFVLEDDKPAAADA